MHMEYECVREKPGGLPSHQFTWNLGGEGKISGRVGPVNPFTGFRLPPSVLTLRFHVNRWESKTWNLGPGHLDLGIHVPTTCEEVS